MQIDYHHGATYVCCRLGGMPAEQAAIVAHASQYVDDATHDGPLSFSTGERYVRVTSAHRALDLRWNADRNDNRLVWVPFHFLPGNDAAPASAHASDAFLTRMICRPNSAIAQELVFDCIVKQQLPFSLHRLGIALHTYIDTWAHQGFVGMIEDFNKVEEIRIVPDDAYRHAPIFDDLTGGATAAKAYVSNLLPVGHAAVLTLPDLPFLKWSYERENGERVVRDNPSDFLQAATHMFNMVRRYVAKDPSLTLTELPQADREVMDRLTRTTISMDGKERHQVWLDAVRQGTFSFGAEQIEYVECGTGSWKFIAIGADPDQEDGTEEYEFSPAFLTSHWKRFHDAVQYQRLFVLHELLPRHGIAAS